ncbi:tRNA 2-selenouridine(34) synthase MnmH [Noviherbaspirillum cavernae]|uniref:tRNA 2-selenouridine(34) synthase MnmH n=1 Tax=Noviherbaspirillum cavernae TaxID=2320862 RepID=A0A418WWI3_9BURK|nr:tRNA 2-selenouridine(34) synthase MnmH [Noviherbaspirillum cavernae]RJF97060.1 tRNA 2-selenouridine(34) synthase MnmH [Noviherbaspirillum cavernae]
MRDFQSYDLIIDARSPREYEEDHIPGAINLPVVDNDEYAEVGTLHRTDPMAAYQIGVCYSLKNIARHLQQHVAQYNRKSRILVYCFRGGKRSRLWFDALDTIGYRVDRLEGGWKGYRRWVNEQLTIVPRNYRYLVLSGPTGCGKTRLLTALHKAGAQVLDLEDIAVHRGSVIGAVPGREQPTQKLFDSFLLRKFSEFDPAKPIWIEAESKKIGKVQLPDALLESMRDGTTISIDAAMPQRVQLWREDYRHFEEDPLALLTRLAYLRPLIGGQEFAEWQRLAESGQVTELFERLMRNHYDPTYRRSMLRNYPEIDASPKIELDDLSTEALSRVAQSMRLEFEVIAAARGA